jgi:hypothetical protein
VGRALALGEPAGSGVRGSRGETRGSLGWGFMGIPVIVVVADDEPVREALVADLARRYSPDYEVACGSSPWAVE